MQSDRYPDAADDWKRSGLFFVFSRPRLEIQDGAQLVKLRILTLSVHTVQNSISIISSPATVPLPGPPKTPPCLFWNLMVIFWQSNKWLPLLPIAAPPQGWEAVHGRGRAGGGEGAAPVSLSWPPHQRRVKTTPSSCERWGLRIISNSWRQLVASSCPDSCHDVVIVSRFANRKRPAAPGGQVKRRPKWIISLF